jgi:hypothetical protein
MNPLGTDWRKSTKSAQSNCVEVAYQQESGVIMVRDTKAAEMGPVLSFTRAEWNAFLGGVHAGEFEIPAELS